MMPRVMVVEDQRIMRDSIRQVLEEAGYKAPGYGRPEEALAAVTVERPDVIITDVRMPGMTGIELLKKVKEILPFVEVVVMTAYGTVKDAVSAMKEGAFDYLLKPFEPEELVLVAQKALERRRFAVDAELKKRETRTTLVGRDSGLAKLYEQVVQIAGTGSTVFVRGESGVGKEVVAKLIHELSDRKDKPFVKVNCAALSAGLLESELFGHTKGAFTGAQADRAGRFELADGGSLLLDEVSEIPLELQAKLLRVLQEKEFERVGSSKTRRVDVRIIATSNRDVEEEVGKGRFREDLYFRLNVVPLPVPPLREHSEDIPALVDYFIERFRVEMGRKVAKPAAGVMKKLAAYGWPGNVRELANAIERALVLNPAPEIDITVDGAGVARKTEDPAGTVFAAREGMKLDEIERGVILSVLGSKGGHRKNTAEELGISERSLREKLKKYREAGVHDET
ncbi:MAG: sigma-54-dependent Fis family transcriptional regulator [Planctomycetes bacterium]|nr:sigma-54-dependent Fis family transcriptional regulator [Planctomycetota bacterium]